MTNERSDNFAETLSELISARRASEGGRKELASELGISEATLSHYIRGRVKPSFDVLLALARTLNVSLDYLVFGERPRAAVEEPASNTAAQIRRALADARDQAGRQAVLMGRVMRHLEARVSDAIEGVVNDRGALGPPGFFTDGELIALEAGARHVSIMTALFQSDVTQGGEPGPFLGVLSENLAHGTRYDYLLTGTPDNWMRSVTSLRVLAAAESGWEIINEQLRFRAADYPLTSAIVILTVDAERISRIEPVLWDRIVDHVSSDNRWAYVSVEREDASGGVSIEPIYLKNTLELWDKTFPTAKPVRV